METRTITIRVPVALKEQVDNLAQELGISRSALWKIVLFDRIPRDKEELRKMILRHEPARARKPPSRSA